MIRLMAHLDQRFELDLILMSSDRDYLSWLRAQTGGDPRIRFLEPVPVRELPRFLNQFDVGVYIQAARRLSSETSRAGLLGLVDRVLREPGEI